MSALIAEKASPVNDLQLTCSTSKSHNGESKQGEPRESCAKSESAKYNDKRTVADHHEKDRVSQPSSNDRPESNQRSKSKDASEKSDLSTDATNTSNDDSSPQTDGARRPSTTSRFKDKRPEPLKLNPNLNQDIPLDLSVKSAGNVPSGTLSNIFNLGPSNSIGPLETPRIQWQDNDALLATNKSLLFSTSTNASQRLPISSMISDSPPMTPGTPLMDLMFSPNGTTSMRLANDTSYSASLTLESPLSSLLISPFELNKLQILDKLAQSNKPLVDYHNMRADLRVRRSCSTDSLTSAMNHTKNQIIGNNFRHKIKQDDKNLMNGLTATTKKSAISPLATKNLSNQADKTVSSMTKFPYTTNHASSTNYSDAQKSPTYSATGKALTPTSVANATANLLNISLSSSNSNSHQSHNGSSNDITKINQNSSQCKIPNFSSLDQDQTILDPIITAAYCQQQIQQNSRTSLTNLSVNHADQHHISHHQHQGMSNGPNNATLNTPTLISPNHMKSGQLCFLHSPMSPMSSMFDLPSPFLMFPPTNSHGAQQQSLSSNHDNRNCFSNQTVVKTSERTNKSAQNTSKDRDGSGPCIQDNIRQTQQNVEQPNIFKNNALRRTWSANASESAPNTSDLSRLITSATQKTGLLSTNNVHQNHSTEMDVDEIAAHLIAGERSRANHMSESTLRPATVIPQICVSGDPNSRTMNGRLKAGPEQDETHRSSHPSLHIPGGLKECSEERKQRNILGKRSLSPKSFRAKVHSYHLERHESSSAPPDVYQRRIKSKIKSVTADSCVDLNSKGDISKTKLKEGLQGQPQSHSQTDIKLSNDHQDRSSAKPYPVCRGWPATSSQHLQTKPSSTNEIFPLGTRSNSAEPAIYSSNPSVNVQQYVTPKNASPREQSNLYEIPYHSVSCQSMTVGQSNQATSLRLHRPNLTQHLQQSPHHPSQNQLSLGQQHRYQHEYVQPPYSNQHHSISTGDLIRLQSFRHGCAPPTIHQPPSHMTTSYDALVHSQACHYQQQQQQHQPLANSNQNTPSSLSNSQLLHSNSRPIMVDNIHRYNSMSATHSSTHQTTSKSELLCRFDICNQSKIQGTVTVPLPGIQHISPMESSSFAHSEAHNSNYLCQIDMDTRSDSRSSCSLDFTGSFAGSRSNSSASSNLTAKKYHCDLCSKSFTRSDMLTRHKRLHSGDRPFQCGECKQEFSRSDHLSTHMRTHTGEKPYKCKLCSYSACRKDMITRHLKVHNKSPS